MAIYHRILKYLLYKKDTKQTKGKPVALVRLLRDILWTQKQGEGVGREMVTEVVERGGE